MNDPWKSGAPNNQLTPRERYRRDAQFHTLVDTMRVMIDKARYTPTELREAAILAATIEHERSVRTRVYIDAESWLKAGFDGEDVRNRQLQGDVK